MILFLLGWLIPILIFILEKEPFFDFHQKLIFFHWFIQWFYQHIMGVYVQISKQPLLQNSSKILVVANHAGFTDFLTLLCLHFQYFPKHDPIFVMGKMYSNVPMIDKYFNKSPHFTVYNGISEKELEDLKTYLESYPRCFVLYIFPEGKVWTPENLKHSQQTKDGSYLRYLLFPKSKGVETFLPIVDSVIDATLLYKGSQAYREIGFLFGKYPSGVLVMTEDVTELMKHKKRSMLFLWRKKDNIIHSFETQKQQFPETERYVRFPFLFLALLFGLFFLQGNKFGQVISGATMIGCLEQGWNRHNHLYQSLVIFLLAYLFI